MKRRTLLAAPFVAYSQEVTFTAGVRVVNVLASVRDKNGAIIADLTKDDFLLSEQGRPQTIQYFSRDGDLPLTLGLLVDTSMSQERVLAAERSASLQFLDQVLRVEKDKVFVLQFDSRVLIKQMLTNSYNKLEEALTQVDTPTRGELRQGIGGGTVLYDAIDTAARFLLKDQTGRKALILLTDGVDYGSSSTLAEAIEAAQKQDTIIYSILFAEQEVILGEIGDDGAVLVADRRQYIDDSDTRRESNFLRIGSQRHGEYRTAGNHGLPFRRFSNRG